MAVHPILKTAPTESKWGEIDLLDKAEVYLLDPVDNDVITRNYKGQQDRNLRSVQRRMAIRTKGLTVDDAELLQQWYNNRTRVRPFANYGERTIFYQCFQRADAQGAPSRQIGPAGTAFAHTFVSTEGNATYINDAGKIIKVGENVPRYEPCAYGMKGIMVETGPIYQNFPYTHPNATGGVLWSTRGVGTPEIAASTTVESIVDGETQVTRVRLDNGEGVMRSTPGSGTMWSDTSGVYSAHVWVKGIGDVDVLLLDHALATKKSQAVTLSGEWEEVKLEAAVKSATGAWSIEITATAASGALLFIGPSGMYNWYRIESHIHNEHGVNEVQLNAPVIEYPVHVPDLEATIYACIAQPSKTLDRQEYFILNNGATWNTSFYIEMGTSGSPTWYLAKRDSGTAAFVPTVDAGDPLIIAGSYGLSTKRIYENGTYKDDAAMPVPPSFGFDDFHLGNLDSTPPNNGGIKNVAFIRIDEGKATDAEILAQAQLYTDEEQRFWTLRCEGRNFEIEAAEVRMVEGNPDRFQGTIVLREVYSYESSTIEVA